MAEYTKGVKEKNHQVRFKYLYLPKEENDWKEGTLVFRDNMTQEKAKIDVF
jgi:hypothetical protein